MADRKFRKHFVHHRLLDDCSTVCIVGEMVRRSRSPAKKASVSIGVLESGIGAASDPGLNAGFPPSPLLWRWSVVAKQEKKLAFKWER